MEILILIAMMTIPMIGLCSLPLIADGKSLQPDSAKEQENNMNKYNELGEPICINSAKISHAASM